MPGSAVFTIKLGGEKDKRISAEALKEALESALEMLNSVGEDFAPAGTPVRWEVVKASMRSPLTLSFAPVIEGKNTRGLGNKIVRATVDGAWRVEKRAALPPHFNEQTLEATSNLRKVARQEGAKVTIAANGKKVTLTENTTEHVKEIVEKARIYLDYGTIEGAIEILSVHGRPSFSVFERLTGHKVECLGGTDHFPLYEKKADSGDASPAKSESGKKGAAGPDGQPAEAGRQIQL